MPKIDNYILRKGLDKGKVLDEVPLKRLHKYFLWLEERQPIGPAHIDYIALKEYLNDPVIQKELEGG